MVKSGKLSFLMLLDMITASDTVDHILLEQLKKSYKIRVDAHILINSYLADRMQLVHLMTSDLAFGKLHHSVPEVSVLGFLLFIMNIGDLDVHMA